MTDVKKAMLAQMKRALRAGYKHYQAQKYRLILKRYGVSEKEILILATITKTGTHYIRFLLANYLKLLEDPHCEPVQPREVDQMFPNSWHTTYQGARSFRVPTPLLRHVGLFDLPRSHVEFQETAWKRSRVLHTYRNPFDFAVFLYVFKYEYCRASAGKYKSPLEVLEKHLEAYVSQYLSFKKAARDSNNIVLSIAYEDLVRYPQVCLGMVLRWLGVEANPSLLAAAISHSSEQETAVFGAGEAWQRDGTPAVNARLISMLTEKCLREGSIGRWKEYFCESDVERVKEKLSYYGINIDEFVLSV